MNFDRLDPHSFYDRDTRRRTARRFDGNALTRPVAVGVGGGDGGGGGVGDETTPETGTATTVGRSGDDAIDAVGDADANASKSLRNYACYNYYPRIYHRRQGVVLNCMMVLCLAICKVK